MSISDIFSWNIDRDIAVVYGVWTWRHRRNMKSNRTNDFSEYRAVPQKFMVAMPVLVLWNKQIQGVSDGPVPTDLPKTSEKLDKTRRKASEMRLRWIHTKK